MSSTLERLRQEIRNLPFAERSLLVSTLEADLDNDEPTARSEIGEAWDAVESIRVNEVLNGEVKLLSFADLQRRLNEVRARHSA